MTRIESILERVRDSLSDPDEIRYTTPRLLRLIDSAQKTIASKAKLLRTTTTIPLVLGQAVYDLPEDTQAILRVLDEDKDKLDLYTHYQADKEFGDSWETDTGSVVEAIVYDKNEANTIKVYPIPDAGSISDSGTWQIASAEAQVWNPVVFSSPYGVTVDSGYLGDAVINDYGVLVDLTYTSPFIIDPLACTGYTLVDQGILTSPYGVLSNLNDGLYTFINYDPTYGLVVDVEGYTLSSPYGIAVDFSTELTNVWVSGVYGLLTDFSDTGLGLTVYYVKKPVTVTSVYDELAISSRYDEAIKYFVTGMALRDDKDTQSRQMAKDELAFFAIELSDAIQEGSSNSISSEDIHQPRYVGAFD